jgi:hypothetical protein
MLLLYAKTRNDIFQQLVQIIDSRVSGACLENYSNPEELFQRLRRPRLNIKIAVFSIGSTAELDRLLTVRDLLADMRLVLVLADKDPRTLSKAHALAPRFITFDDAGVAPLVSVVEKMMGCQIDRLPRRQSPLEAAHP